MNDFPTIKVDRFAVALLAMFLPIICYGWYTGKGFTGYMGVVFLLMDLYAIFISLRTIIASPDGIQIRYFRAIKRTIPWHRIDRIEVARHRYSTRMLIELDHVRPLPRRKTAEEIQHYTLFHPFRVIDIRIPDQFAANGFLEMHRTYHHPSGEENG